MVNGKEGAQQQSCTLGWFGGLGRHPGRLIEWLSVM
jgi:hypothetical protein